MALLIQTHALHEPNTVPEISCNGLGRIEIIGGGQACYVLYRNTIIPDAAEYGRQAAGRVYAPLEAMPEAIDLMLQALIESGMARAATLAQRFRLM